MKRFLLFAALIAVLVLASCYPPVVTTQESEVDARGVAGPVVYRSLRVLNQLSTDGDLTVGDDVTITDDVTMDALTVGGDITLENGETIGNATDGTILLTGDAEINGATPGLIIGDAGEEDTSIVYDGAAQDFYVALDDSADDLLLGLGATVGTTGIIHLDGNQDVGLGGASAGAKLDITGNQFVDGAADEIQLTVSGYTTQTSSLLVLEQSDGTDVATISNAGAVDVASTINYGTDNLYPLGIADSGKQIVCGTTGLFTETTNVNLTALSSVVSVIALQITDPASTASILTVDVPSTTTVTFNSWESDSTVGTTGVNAYYCAVGNQ